MGSGTQKTVVGKHSSSLHLQMQIKALPHAKRKTDINHPETLLIFLDPSKSTFQTVFGKHGCCIPTVLELSL